MLLTFLAGCPLLNALEANEAANQVLKHAPILLGDINYGPIPAAEEGAEEMKSEQS